MQARATILQALDAARQAGADQAMASLTRSEKTELNIDAGRISLLRTTGNANLALTAFTSGRKGAITVNQTSPSAIAAAASEALRFASAAAPDPANGIAPAAPAQQFSYGPEAPDRAAMYERLTEFLAYAARVHPLIKLEQCCFDFTRSESLLGNSHGVDFAQSSGLYSFQVMFTAKDGTRTSSFNYTAAKHRDLAQPLCTWGGLDALMQQAAEQLDPRPVSGKFQGEVIFTPHSLSDFVDSIVGVYLGELALIGGTSPWRERLGQRVGSERFTLRSLPASKRIQAGYFFTPDGFAVADATLIEQGILRGFQLGLYGSNKTGLPRATTAGGGWIVEPGTTSLAELIAGVERGLLLCRFSGGSPGDNGDFSGVAKNSYLIENGKLSHPVSETMLSGNLGNLLEQVTAVSRDTIDFGSEVYPWVRCGGVTIAGK